MIYEDYHCSICGLPVSEGAGDSIMYERPLPLPPEFDSDEAIASLYRNGGWMSTSIMLCDPDDEFGRLIPSLTYDKMGDMGRRPLAGIGAERCPELPSSPSPIQVYQAEHDKGPHFDIAFEGQTRFVNADNSKNWIDTFDERCYIPIHSACLELSKRVLESSPNRYLDNMRSLFLALRWRHTITLRNGGAAFGRPTQPNYMLGLRHWYMPYWSFWNYFHDFLGEKTRVGEDDDVKVQWPKITKDADCNLKYTFLADPIAVENLTETILLNLQPCPRDALPCNDDDMSLRARLATLPDDILDIIISHVRCLRDLPRKNTHILPQSFWENELLRGGDGLLPWLWDIDKDKVNAKADEQPRPPDGRDLPQEWDWELLVRQLSRSVDGGVRHDVPEHVDIYTPTWDDTTAPKAPPQPYDRLEDIWACTGYWEDLQHVPRGLHNRRRIWQLVEEMFVGDVLPLAGKPTVGNYGFIPTDQAVEMPWTKAGGKLEGGQIWWVPSRENTTVYTRRIGGEVYRTTAPNRWGPDDQRHTKYDGCSVGLYDTKPNKHDWGVGVSLKCWGEQHKPASIQEILNNLRELGYPMSKERAQSS